MNSSIDKTKTTHVVSTRWIGIGFASYALLGSLSSFLGWILQIPRLTDWIGSGIAMFPNAALSAGCAAIALMLAGGRRSRAASWVSFACGAISFFIGIATLFEHITGLSIGIDNLLLETTWGRAAVAPGRMGPPAAFAFTLLGLAVLLSSRARTRRLAPMLGIIVFALVTLAITGYAFGADRLYAIARYTGIALPTATICLALAIAVIVNVPECEPALTVFGDCAAGMLVRRALFFIVPMPFLLGWLCVIGQEKALFDSGMGTALLIIALMFMLCSLVWWSATAIKKRESAVRESEERFRTMADSTPTMIWVTNARGEIEFVNRAYLEFFGVRAEQVRGPEGWHPLVHPEDSASYIRAYATALQDRQPFTAEARVRHADGTWRWIASYGAPHFSDTGEFVGHAGSSPDITKLKEVQEALRESERRLSAELDATQRLQQISTQLVQIDDISALYEKIIDAAVAIMRADFASMQRFHPDRGEGWGLELLTYRGFNAQAAASWKWIDKRNGTACGRVFETGERVIVEDVRNDAELQRDGRGEVYEATGIRSVQSTPLFSRSGQMLGVISTHWRTPHQPEPGEFRMLDVLARIAADLIDRALAEESLRQTQQRLEVALQASGAVTWGWDVVENKLDEWTPEYRELFGFSAAGPATIETWLRSIHPDDSARLRQRVQQMLDTPGDDIWNEEFRINHPVRGVRWIGGVGRALRDDAGRVRRMTGVNVDITERKQTEAALRDAHEQLASRAVQLESLVQERTAKLRDMVYELEHVSYAITHDMRAPLRAMSAFATLLLEHENASGNAETIEFSQRIISAANRLDRLIQDSLHYTKTVLQEISFAPVDLEILVQDLLATYPNLQPDKVDVRIEGVLPRVLGSEALLTQCFSNLLGNAVKFVPPGRRPQVRIRVEKGDSVARIWIEDNGIGIPRHSQERLFKMFQRLTSDYEGSGVGLAIVRKVVERMGGKVGVESEPGEGSRFWLELPLAPNGGSQAPHGGNTPERSP